jgi:hypothetical protein
MSDNKPAKAKAKRGHQDLIIERIYEPDEERMRRLLELLLSKDNEPKKPRE